MAISPDVVSLVHDRFGYCDLRRRGGVADVAGKTSSISLTPGRRANVACCLGVPKMMEAPALNPSDGDLSFMRPHLPGLSVLSS